MFADYDYFASRYGCAVDETAFNRLAYDADRYLINATTGLNGYKKLIKAFPTNPYDAEAVKAAECKVIKALYDIENAERNEQEIAGVVIREDGTVTPRRISSISSGAESISFSSAGASSSYAIAANSASAKQSTAYAIIKESLEGIKDANGVNLLYMG